MTGQDTAPGSHSPPNTKEKDPDADLLSELTCGIAARQSRALSTLMDRHLASIKSTAWHMVRDEMSAEDIAQEVFLRAWKQAPKWQFGNAKFSTWMHRVAKNLCYDKLRKKTEILSDEIPEIADKDLLAQDKIIQMEKTAIQKNLIADAMDTLPDRQKMAITLCHYGEKSQIEAAAIMEMNVRAYESLLARGRKNLRSILNARKKELLES